MIYRPGRIQNGEKISFFRGPLGQDSKSRRPRLPWLSLIQRNDLVPIPYTKVCSQHFVSGMLVNISLSVEYAPSVQKGYEKERIADYQEQ